jgi:hypothetical protein
VKNSSLVIYMREDFHKISMVLFIILVFGSVAVTGVAARTQGSVVEIKLNADTPVPNAQFGRSVALDGDLVAVGEGGDGAVGAVYLYRRQGMQYVPEATLISPDAIPGIFPEFGRTVAIQGNMVIVGARFAPVGDLERAGAVYVFRKHGDSWQFEDKIVSPAPEEEDNFGRALSIQGDLLVVTARKTANEEGAAYVYVYSDGQWSLKITLTAGDPIKNAYFGQSVDIQGDLIAIGARNANPNGAGAVYLFRNVSDVWTQVAKVTPYDGKKNDQYGFAVALSGDTMTVGSRRADPDGKADAGAVYVYTINEDSASLVTRLTPDDAIAGDEFGQSVAFAGDTLAAGAWKDDMGSNADQGSLYLFRRSGGQWIQTGKITASDGMAGDEFGYSLAASGNRMVTGAHFVNAKAGAAYVLTVKPL